MSASWAVLALGWLLMLVGWLLEQPYSTLLFAAAAIVLVPEAVRSYRAWRRSRESVR